MENWKRVEDPREFHFIFMILYSYINLHIAIYGGILRYPSTEHVLLPSLHSLLIIYDHPQSHLWRRRATWHRTATLATNYTTFIVSIFCAPALKLPIKIQFLFGAIFYTINYSSGILVSFVDTPWVKFFISCAGAFIAGLSGGPLWVSQGRFIHLSCVKNN